MNTLHQYMRSIVLPNVKGACVHAAVAAVVMAYTRAWPVEEPRLVGKSRVNESSWGRGDIRERGGKGGERESVSMHQRAAMCAVLH